MPADTPESFGHEPALGVELGPFAIGEGPGIGERGPFLEVLVRPLLIVGDELGEDCDDAKSCEDQVGCRQSLARLERRGVRGEAGSVSSAGDITSIRKVSSPLRKEKEVLHES